MIGESLHIERLVKNPAASGHPRHAADPGGKIGSQGNCSLAVAARSSAARWLRFVEHSLAVVARLVLETWFLTHLRHCVHQFRRPERPGHLVISQAYTIDLEYRQACSRTTIFFFIWRELFNLGESGQGQMRLEA
jgi:hypothetical protein